MSHAYYIPGAVSELFINITSFSPLKDPQKSVLLLSLFIDEKRRLRHSFKYWAWSHTSAKCDARFQNPCSQPLSFAASAGIPYGEQMEQHSTTEIPSLFHYIVWSRTLIYLALILHRFSQLYFISYIIYFFLKLCMVHILQIKINHKLL